MHYKKLVANMICPRYGEGAETVNHVFKSCPFAKEVWGLVGFPRILLNSIQDMFEWLTWVFNNCSVLQRITFCCGLWILWIARNKFMHEHSAKSVVDISRFIQGYIKEIGVKENGVTRKVIYAKWKPLREHASHLILTQLLIRIFSNLGRGL